MPTECTMRSPLDGIGAAPVIETPQVMLREIAFRRYFNLRGRPGELGPVIRQVTGLELPVRPNTRVENDKAMLLWLGPDEWLLLNEPDSKSDFAFLLCGAMADRFYALTDISSGWTTLLLRGNKARDVLERGCPLDLHPRHFNTGQCAQTLIGKTGATLIPRARPKGETCDYQIIVRRSFAEYLWLWLERAMREYS